MKSHDHNAPRYALRFALCHPSIAARFADSTARYCGGRLSSTSLGIWMLPLKSNVSDAFTGHRLSAAARRPIGSTNEHGLAEPEFVVRHRIEFA